MRMDHDDQQHGDAANAVQAFDVGMFFVLFNARVQFMPDVVGDLS